MPWYLSAEEFIRLRPSQEEVVSDGLGARDVRVDCNYMSNDRAALEWGFMEV